MANEKQLIRSITEPTIELDDMSMIDVEEGTSKDAGFAKSDNKISKQLGAVLPYIRINGFSFQGEDIIEATISVRGNRPSFRCTVYVSDKSFYSKHYPKDGDLASVLVRSKDDKLKPIRNDYEITNVSNYSKGPEGSTEDTLSISGLLRIPGLDAEMCFSKKGTSMEALVSTCHDIGLGFSSNEVNTADTMSWICPFNTVNDFIFSVVNASWKDTSSFFHYFIDQYYHLNFVNVNPLFSEQAETDDGILFDNFTNDYSAGNSTMKTTEKLLLSNISEYEGTSNYVKSASINNFSAAINIREGYKRYVQYYDSLIKEYQSIYVDPITSPDAENNSIILKGRKDEDFYLKQVKHKWMGILYGNGENCHEKYLYAQIHNHQNLVHLNKIVLKVELGQFNPNLRRGMVIPYIHTIRRDRTRKEANTPEFITTQDSIGMTIDKFYSGYFKINSMDIVYRNGEMFQTLDLIRREWPTPVK